MKKITLRIPRHSRDSDVATWNGHVRQVGARVEHDPEDPRENAAEIAAQIEEWNEKERQYKALRLARFQREVKSRVSTRGKLIQQEMGALSSKAMQSEQAAAEKAIKLESPTKTKRPQSAVVGHDVEDVLMMASGRDSSISDSQRFLTLQKARRALLSQKVKPGTSSGSKDDDYQQEKSRYNNEKHKEDQEKDTERRRRIHYRDVEQMSSESCSLRLSPAVSKHSAVLSEDASSAEGVTRKFVAPGKLEHLEKKQAERQFLVLRRLYSDLEREKARKRKMQNSHTRSVKALKRKKEAERKRVEDEVNPVDSGSVISIVSTDSSEDQRKVSEWHELMLLEEKKQQLLSTIKDKVRKINYCPLQFR